MTSILDDDAGDLPSMNELEDDMGVGGGGFYDDDDDDGGGLGDHDDYDDEEEDDYGGGKDDDGSDEDNGDDTESPQLPMMDSAESGVDLEQKMFGILINPTAEPSLVNGDGAETGKKGKGGAKTAKTKAKGKAPAKKAAAAAATSAAAATKPKKKKSKAKKAASDDGFGDDFDIDEFMSEIGSVAGGNGGGDDDEFGFNIGGSAGASSGPVTGPKTVAGANAFFGSYDMYPGEMQASMQERADLINLYEMLKKRGYVSQHDVPNLPLEDMRFEVFRLQRLDEMGDAVSGYKNFLTSITNGFELFAPTIQHFTGVMFNGVSMRMHMAMERGEMTRAFQGIYHKRSKNGPWPPEITLGWAILMCFFNVAVENYQASQSNYIHMPSAQQYHHPPPPPPPQQYHYYPYYNAPQHHPQWQQPYPSMPPPPPPPQQQQQAPSPLPSQAQQAQQQRPQSEEMNFYSEVRQPQLQQLQEQQQQQSQTRDGFLQSFFNTVLGGGAPQQASTSQNQMSQMGPPPASPNPQFQATPNVKSNPLQLKENLAKLSGKMSN